ncbi:multidrug transporter MatE [Photobacterium kishitanii]|uniref:Multidrug export protein MepA n=1 Tax=Photobacterium kishitanii TaxID=318456 RepID=A0AAX0YX20_9GAMM|nr:MATE family efflux transporter [Photobacterium kishitanii]KJG59821.1 multidrug transporter MatE [Photobacterium kishitanii]KJG63105.1 multidrug transporter MatE [Photobacterium kishitanii]KJG67881.1 multidrug transporter MatE [Photobacterium kishitanii]KJG71278.1 multidrug transporter MatE [Photobacterium kishitanii]PSX20391.1 MATE family efflux transporter [Photobacterium kishitanii]
MTVSTTQPLSLRDDSIFRLFWRYTLPTIAAMLITGIYVAVDGMFVGHFIGEDGLAAIMLGYPIGSILYAIGAMIGMGASALVSIKMGEDNTQQARHIVGNALTLCIIAAIIFCSFGLVFGQDILIWIGAKDHILAMASEYLFWYFTMGSFAIVSMAFSALLRNDGQPNRVTLIMILGGVLNIFLDWLFIVVIPWGLTGAAVATMLSQAVTCILCLQHFFTDKTQLRIGWDSLKIKFDTVLQILKLGTSSLLMYMYLSVVLILHNKAFLMVGKPIHVAAYGIVSYTEAFFYLIFEGIALGTQPLVSFNTGAGLKDRVAKIRNLAFMITLLIGVIGVVTLYSIPEAVVYMFAGDNTALQPEAIKGMSLYFWGLPFEGLLLVGATYFQAINMPKEASLLTGGKLILISIAIFVLAHSIGVNGVWLALPICSAALTLWMVFRLRKLSMSNVDTEPQQ